ncbi:hypothetical protein [Amycolatopsis sp. lyj-23]|uniref:hypothetical protein n=1 Tax=Amycolatopsis sp. lyj-23 TaxID=2789283 RepID=UPI00397D5723
MNGSAEALSGSEELTLASFFDLCSLIDACVILDELQVFSSIDPLPDSPITDRLADGGVLREFEPVLSRADLRRVLMRLPDALGEGLQPQWFPGQGYPVADRDLRRHGEVDDTGAVPPFDFSAGLDDLQRQLRQIIQYPSVHNSTEQRMRRSQAYLAVAAANGLDYFPDYDRVPFAAAGLREVYRSLPVQLYEKVSDAFGQRVGQEDMISEWTLHATLAVPAASALVLHRAESLADVPECLMLVRKEFRSYRDHFRDFRAKLSEADSLARRRKLLRTYQALLVEVSGPRSEIISVTEMLNLAQAGVKAGAAPLAVTSYGASLLTQPAEWLRRWWARRPLAVLFRLDGKLPRISEYRQLVAKLWGEEANERLLEKLGQHPEQVGRLMRLF